MATATKLAAGASNNQNKHHNDKNDGYQNTKDKLNPLSSKDNMLGESDGNDKSKIKNSIEYDVLVRRAASFVITCCDVEKHMNRVLDVLREERKTREKNGCDESIFLDNTNIIKTKNTSLTCL